MNSYSVLRSVVPGRGHRSRRHAGRTGLPPRMVPHTLRDGRELRGVPFGIPSAHLRPGKADGVAVTILRR